MLSHALFIALLSLIIYSLTKLEERETINMIWVQRIMITLSIFGYILYFYNKRMVGLFNFEKKFEQNIKQLDVEVYEKHQITQMKGIDPEEYYRIIENFYCTQYPALRFHIILSTEIETYPNNPLFKPIYILILFLKELLRVYPRSDLSSARDCNIPSLRATIPTVKVLTFYEWVHNDFYELWFKYMNPVAVIGGYYANSLMTFGLLTVIGYLITSKMIKIQQGEKASANLIQMEFNAIQRDYNIRVKEKNRQVGQEFTNKIVNNLKAIKRRHNQFTHHP